MSRLERSREENFVPGLIPGPYDPADTAGFHCLCPPGLTGPTCEEDLPGESSCVYTLPPLYART